MTVATFGDELLLVPPLATQLPVLLELLLDPPPPKTAPPEPPPHAATPMAMRAIAIDRLINARTSSLSGVVSGSGESVRRIEFGSRVSGSGVAALADVARRD